MKISSFKVIVIFRNIYEVIILQSVVTQTSVSPQQLPRDIQDETFSRSEEDGVCGRCGLNLYRHRGRPLLPPQPCGASSAMTSPSVTLNTMIALYPPGP